MFVPDFDHCVVRIFPMCKRTLIILCHRVDVCKHSYDSQPLIQRSLKSVNLPSSLKTSTGTFLIRPLLVPKSIIRLLSYHVWMRSRLCHSVLLNLCDQNQRKLWPFGLLFPSDADLFCEAPVKVVIHYLSTVF